MEHEFDPLGVLSEFEFNPHFENHGSHAVEWSYHFPVVPASCVDVLVELEFPKNRVPGSAMRSMERANLSFTRMSFAHSASDIRQHALDFFRDSLWLHSRLCEPALVDESQIRATIRSTKFFLKNASKYWNQSFFSRLGIFLQSDIKQYERGIKQALKLELNEGRIQWDALLKAKSSLVYSFRAAFRIVKARETWESIMVLTHLRQPLREILRGYELEADTLYLQLKQLSEFSCMLVTRAVAEMQDHLNRTQKHLKELRQEARDADDIQQIPIIDSEIILLERHKAFFNAWARRCLEWSKVCGLPEFSEIVQHEDIASRYFERLRRLKRVHYRMWDLDVKLKPVESKYTIFITSFSAGVSALLAFVLTSGWLVYHGGQVNFSNMGLMALFVFGIGNVFVYVIKDRLKDWLKNNMGNFLGLKKGEWVGDFKISDPEVDEAISGLPYQTTHLRRQTWWNDRNDSLSFFIKERFSVAESGLKRNHVHILKQTWRLPLDDILNSMDTAVHILKIPGVDGHPSEIRILKKNRFNYSLKICLTDVSRRQVISEAKLEGHVQASGGRLISVY